MLIEAPWSGWWVASSVKNLKIQKTSSACKIWSVFPVLFAAEMAWECIGKIQPYCHGSIQVVELTALLWCVLRLPGRWTSHLQICWAVLYLTGWGAKWRFAIPLGAAAAVPVQRLKGAESKSISSTSDETLYFWIGLVSSVIFLKCNTDNCILYILQKYKLSFTTLNPFYLRRKVADVAQKLNEMMWESLASG